MVVTFLYIEPHQGSISVYLVNFGPLWSALVHSVHFNSVLSILVLFGPLWSSSVQFGDALEEKFV